MVRRLLFLLALTFTTNLFAQQSDSFPLMEARRLLSVLASDSLEGRGNYTPGLQKAGAFIASYFDSLRLDSFPGQNGYFQYFIPELEGRFRGDSTAFYKSPNLLANVIAMIPGKSLPEEIIVFSAHYDHLGRPAASGPVFNGANDNASGTVALMMLARYFAMRNDNARTLLFCAFSGEELGLFGSEFFVSKIKASSFIANINIEMIGRTDATGPNAFFITGRSRSRLGSIMKTNLSGSGIRLVSDPDESRELYNRSDNYSFVRKGIPGHSVMSSTDADPCYHEACDDWERLNIENMVKVIGGIAISVRTLVDGTEDLKKKKKKK